ncbi:MAG TPA: ANTAR domain-containing protein, partial [Thermoanaerobaculia bacterium]|nr:ANTAR domain-containing protein [Thermoanaerobaculia bacterium]
MSIGGPSGGRHTSGSARAQPGSRRHSRSRHGEIGKIPHRSTGIHRGARNAACPVILILDARDQDFVNEAAQRGVFAYIVDGDQEQLQSALDITLRRFAEYHNLEGAFGRRAIIERAKGILMAVHGIDEQEAFELLRDDSQRDGRKLVEIAEAVTQTHRLLTPKPATAPKQEPERTRQAP